MVFSFSYDKALIIQGRTSNLGSDDLYVYGYVQFGLRNIMDHDKYLIFPH